MNYIRGLILNLILLALAFAKGSTVEKNEIQISRNHSVFKAVKNTLV